MSIRAVETVLQAPISPPTLKLTAIVMANALNDRSGKLNPSIAYVAGQVGISRSQAQRMLRQLIDAGLLSVTANATGGAPGTTPHYRLHIDRIAAMVPTGRADAAPTDSTDATRTGSISATGSTDATGSTHAAEGSHGCGRGVAPMRETGSTHATQTVLNRNEPEGNRRASAPKRGTRQGEPLGFEAFYSAYPKHVARAEAAQAFGKIGVDATLLQTMLAAIERQARSEDWRKQDGKYVPHPATWLNGRRWLDELPKGQAQGYIGSAEGRSANGVSL